MIHHCTPYRIDKNLGKAYNDAMSIIGNNDWMCFRDIDTMFLLPEQPAMIEQYVELFSSAGLLTCYTNRIHPLSQQLLNQVSEDDAIRKHMRVAEQQALIGYNVTELTKHISGFLMVISKKTWNELPFPETDQALGVDTLYWQRLVRAGKKILRMDSVYIWHTYRLNNINDKSHLS